MNRCLTHNQEYNPATGWCVYCGRPGDGLSAAPVRPTPPPPPASGSIRVCGSCGETIWDSPAATFGHLCRSRITVTQTGTSVIGTPIRFEMPSIGVLQSKLDIGTYRAATYGNEAE